MKTFLAFLGILLAAAVGAIAGAILLLSQGLPEVMSLEEYRPASSTLLFAADSTQIGEIATERRTPVGLDEMPRHLIQAVLAIEDHRYFEHHGINVTRILKALAVDVFSGEIRQGGSTITQQLAKMLFLTPEKKLTRKIREAILAFQIEKEYTKEEILTFYLNQIYLGNGAYGVSAAARVYFDKEVSQLTIPESALLAALPRAPAAYDPFRHPEAAKERRDTVLRRMRELNWVSEEEHQKALRTPLPSSGPKRNRALAPYFVESVRRELVAAFGEDMVYRGGLRVYTTLDAPLQTAAEEALRKNAAEVEKRHPRDPGKVESAALGIDPASGAVRLQVGGLSWTKSQFDRTWQAKRQMGSTFKPFIYIAALEAGHTQANLLVDSPAEFPGARPDRPWRPQNYDDEYHGRMTYREALSHSRNVPAVRLMDRLGIAPVEAVTKRMGLPNAMGEGLASALGVGAATLTDLTAAYAALPAGGLRPEPYRIRAVHGPDGTSLWKSPPTPRRVLTPQVAAVAADLLKSVVDSGTARNAAALNLVLGGKTGTTDDQRDASFIGFSSRLALGVWVGRDDYTPLGRGETGARAALPAWIDIMNSARERQPPPSWETPPDIEYKLIDLETGFLAGTGCGNKTALAAFLPGTAPTRFCGHGGKPRAAQGTP